MKDLIDWDALADASELDDYLTPEELSEVDVMRLERQSFSAELTSIAERLQKSLDRMKYYGEVLDYDEAEFLHREILRIVKNFG